MPTILQDDPILSRFRADLDDALKDFIDFHEEVVRLADLETAVLFNTGAVINALPFSVEAYQRENG